MQTFSRICIEDYEIIDDEKKLSLHRGTEYLTSKEENGLVTVFSTYWASVPVELFAGEIEFTKAEDNDATV